MTALPVPLELPADGPATLDHALDALRAAPAADRAALYERLVFPFAAVAARARAANEPTARLLIVPVGTQPYSPLLAILSCKAERVVLLVTEPQGGEGGEVGIGTEGSRPTANRVLATLADGGIIPRDRVQVSSIGDGTAGEEIVLAVTAALFFAGDPRATEVTVDISGGRKSTTAALGSIAGILGFRLAYIEGRHVIGGFYADERRHNLANVAAMLDVDRRYAATRMVQTGAWAAAVEEITALQEAILAPPGADVLLRFSAAMERAETGEAAAGAAALEGLVSDLRASSATEWHGVADLLVGGVEHLAAGHSRTRLARALVDRLEQIGAWR